MVGGAPLRGVARKPRAEEAGAIWHVWSRGVDKRDIFLTDDDRVRYLGGLATVVTRWEWSCLGYCLMDNHIHLLVETPKPTLALGMGQLHGDYARQFNRRYRRTGHLFQGRYGAKRMRTDQQLLTVVRYLAANPVEAQLCDEPVGYRWCSVAATAGIEPAPPWLATARLLGLVDGIGGGEGTGRYLQLHAS